MTSRMRSLPKPWGPFDAPLTASPRANRRGVVATVLLLLVASPWVHKAVAAAPRDTTPPHIKKKNRDDQLKALKGILGIRVDEHSKVMQTIIEVQELLGEGKDVPAVLRTAKEILGGDLTLQAALTQARDLVSQRPVIQELRSLQQQIDAQKKETEELKKKLAQRPPDTTTLEQRLKELKDAIRKKTAEKDTLEKSITKLKNDRQPLADEVKKLGESQKALAPEVESLGKRKAALQKDIPKAKSNLETLMADLARAKMVEKLADLRDWEAQIGPHLRAKLEELGLGRELTDQQLKQLNVAEQTKLLQDGIDQKTAALARLKGESEKTANTHNDLKDKIVDLTKQRTKLEEDIAGLIRQKEELGADTAKLRSEAEKEVGQSDLANKDQLAAEIAEAETADDLAKATIKVIAAFNKEEDRPASYLTWLFLGLAVVGIVLAAFFGLRQRGKGGQVQKLLQDKEDLAQRAASLEHQVKQNTDRFQKERTSYARQVHEQKEKRAAFESEVRRNRKELGELRAKEQNYKSALEKLIGPGGSVEAILAQEKRTQDMLKQVGDLRIQLKSVQEELKRKDLRIAELERTTGGHREEAGALERRLQDKEAELTKQKALVADVQQRVKSTIENDRKRSSEELRRREAALQAAFRTKHKDLQATLDSKEAELESLRAQVEQRLKLAEQNLAGRLTAVQESARAEQERLQSEHQQELGDLNGEIGGLRRQLEQAVATREQRQGRMWPPGFRGARIDGFQEAITQGMLGEPPVPEASALFGAIHQICADVGSTRVTDEAFELSRAFYNWLDKARQPDPAWPEQLAAWLNGLLKDDGIEAVVVKEGEAIQPQRHSPEGRGTVVGSARSFLLRRADGTPRKKAIVVAQPPDDSTMMVIRHNG